MKVVGISNLILDFYFFDNNVYINGGGTVCNILANLANMGVKTSVFGYYGNDLTGKIAKICLEETNVDTSLLIRRNYNNKCFFIDSKQTKSCCPYCNRKTRDFQKRKYVEKYINKDDIILIQDYTTLSNISNKICLDFGYYNSLIHKNNKEIENFIFKKYYIVNLKDSVLLFILKRLNITFDEFKKRIDIYFLIITRGKNGATIVYKDKVYNYDIIKPFKEIETNGCGDAFFATFISEVIKRNNLTKKDIDDIYKLAEKNVNIVISNIGARNHIVENKKIEKNKDCICHDFHIIY